MVNETLQHNSFAVDGQSLSAPTLPAGLYVVATPIGNLADITLRALQTLAAAHVIACEDTRNSRVLLDRYGINTRLTPYHDHNGPQARPALLARLATGEAVALISDAGTPLIADPGYKLVVEARAAGHNVVSIPGPSATIAALSIAGHPTDQFTFAGFLPSKEKARADAIAKISALPGTLCLYEAPSRLAASLQALASGLGDERQASVCREITKRYETVRTGSLEELAGHYTHEENPRGEIVLVIAPAQRAALNQDDIDAALRAALKTERMKDAASLVAETHGLSKRDLYQRALELSGSDR
ncbi:MAG: 16S rRNA (cytidine(1402)-2'-O)-methyltransferase [Devosiaceae bacterium]